MVSIKKLLYKIAKVDYVVESGTDGSYTYKKWNSGICEAWASDSGSAKLNQQVGKWYYGDPITTPSVSSGLFADIPTETVGAFCSSTSSTGLVVGSANIASNLRGGTHTVASGSSVSSSYTYNMHWRLYGRWKEVSPI